MTELYTERTPEAIRNATGLHLITEATPNGKKVQILLEELKDVYSIEWTTSLINLDTDEQKEEWFLHINPNGRIPVIIDNSQSPPFPIMESSAELLYLVERFDKDKVFGFASSDLRGYSEMVQWLFFWQASGQPYQAQNNHFSRSAPEKIPYAISRFRTETLRIYNVLELRLSGRCPLNGSPREYLAGMGKGKYTIADIGAWPYLRSWKYAGFTDEEMARFPHLLQWIARIADRPAVKRGISDVYDSEENPAWRVSTKESSG
ncbi:hypothetical protein VTL71DRAFT_7642 [Oculimacula yallundae]|uniref:Glutathione S-transferase n=1 Tax=Oculimacula yallundae TaxID=86028 RepID=A0ABR4BWD0_9HELO